MKIIRRRSKHVNHSSGSKSKSKSRSKSRSRTRSRTKKAGAQALIGSAWTPAANNSYRELTSHSATANHFRLSPNGVSAGGFQPPVPEMRGPGMRDINTIQRMSGGLRRSNKRTKKGGYILGGFPEMAGTMWNNAVIGVQNVWKGIQGTQQLPSASPWNQSELVKPVNTPLLKPFDISQLRQTAAQRAANV